jgi:hypothetical protein
MTEIINRRLVGVIVLDMLIILMVNNQQIPLFLFIFLFSIQQKMECTRGPPTSKSVVLDKEAKTRRSAGNYFGGKC